MAIQQPDYVTCDGCNKLIDWPATLYRVWFANSDGADCHFHDYNCVRLWVDTQEKIRNDNLALAAAHTELHAKLDAASDIDKDEWQGANKNIEALTLTETQQQIAALGVTTNG